SARRDPRDDVRDVLVLIHHSELLANGDEVLGADDRFAAPAARRVLRRVVAVRRSLDGRRRTAPDDRVGYGFAGCGIPDDARARRPRTGLARDRANDAARPGTRLRN